MIEKHKPHNAEIMAFSKKTTQGWLHVGYKIFADEGPEGIQVERLARILGVNKSSFYHFFVDKEIFMSELIKLHLEHAQRYVAEIKKLDNFDPEFIDLLVAEKEIILFHRQLNKNADNVVFRKTFIEINAVVDCEILRLWAKEIQLPPDPAFKLFDLVRDTFYSRISPKNYSATTVRQIVDEVKLFLAQLDK